MEPAIIEQVINLGASAAMICVVLWGITRTLPEIVSTFRDEIRSERESFLRGLLDQREAFREEMATHRQQSRELDVAWRTTLDRFSVELHDLAEEMRLYRESK